MSLPVWTPSCFRSPAEFRHTAEKWLFVLVNKQKVNRQVYAVTHCLAKIKRHHNIKWWRLPLYIVVNARLYCRVGQYNHPTWLYCWTTFSSEHTTNVKCFIITKGSESAYYLHILIYYCVKRLKPVVSKRFVIKLRSFKNYNFCFLIKTERTKPSVVLISSIMYYINNFLHIKAV